MSDRHDEFDGNRSQQREGWPAGTNPPNARTDGIDAATLQQATQQLIMGNPEEAKATLSQKTDLTKQQFDSIVKGVSQEFQERLGTADNELRTRRPVERVFGQRHGTSRICAGRSPGS